MMVLGKWGYKSLFHVTDSSYPLILTGKEVWITVENAFDCCKADISAIFIS